MISLTLLFSSYDSVVKQARSIIRAGIIRASARGLGLPPWYAPIIAREKYAPCVGTRDCRAPALPGPALRNYVRIDDPRVEPEKLAARGEMPLDARPDLAYGLLPAAAGEQRSQDTPRIPETRSHSDLNSRFPWQHCFQTSLWRRVYPLELVPRVRALS